MFNRETSDGYLYKVAPPRKDLLFEPRAFWRTQDWSSSDDDPRDGYIQEHVLYAGAFDEVNIHLLPKVWRLRVWLDDEDRCARLRALGFEWLEVARAAIFVHEKDRSKVEEFAPTVFAFEREGFEEVPTREWVSREPRRAIDSVTLAFAEVRSRWDFQIFDIPDGEALTSSLRLNHIDHQIQT
jgi:hypothetical protein